MITGFLFMYVFNYRLVLYFKDHVEHPGHVTVIYKPILAIPSSSTYQFIQNHIRSSMSNDYKTSEVCLHVHVS